MGVHRAGFVTIIGRPNVGKSTLLNRLVGEKVAIVSPKPQTTRNRIMGLVTRPDFQLAILDTPGLHKAHGELGRAMIEAALGALSEVDMVLYLVESASTLDEAREVAPGDRYVIDKLREARKPTVLGVNKIDAVPKPLLLPLIDAYRAQYDFARVVPVSALTGEGVDVLLQELAGMAPEGPNLFDPELLTDQAERTLVAEYVREQVLRHCQKEIPYSTAVTVDHFDESDRQPPAAQAAKKPAPRKRGAKPISPPGLGPGLVRIAASIYVERDSQKAIVIGKGGRMLKKIGSAARWEIEKLLGVRVFLSLLVKVEPRWSERPDALKRLGL